MGSGSSSDSAAVSSRRKEPDEGRINRLTDEERKKLDEIFEEKQKSDKALVVKAIDTELANEKKHHTLEYERKDVTILRRGHQFYFKISFDRDIEVKHDVVRLQLTYGEYPRENKGTLIRIPVNLNSTDKTTDVGRSWNVQRLNIGEDGKVMEISVTSPADAFIGYYKVYVETRQDDDKEFSRAKYNKQIIMLFNPWCKDDTVYMEKDAERKEYVMNDRGLIWKGSKYKKLATPWNFGQFEENVLSAAILLLERAELTDEARNNPVAISRKISAVVNSCDDSGVLKGNWSGKYDEGTAPSEWPGSYPIIKEFIKTRRPVKYGQCWVFSGVTTTLLRALGIPTRSVTNYHSAHDTDCSMTIDKLIDVNGKISDMGDSIWNFHVWNECWCKRFDLPPGYDGWQVVDGTPQESSGGLMQCGPTPVRAVKEGHVYMNYDIPFVYAEVNGDVINWKLNENGVMEVATVKHDFVGADISTKAVGTNGRHDITGDYRYPNGSAEETKVRELVSRFSSKTKRIRHVYEDYVPEKEIKIELKCPENSLFGEDFTIHANIMNTTNEERKVSACVTILHSHYTGVAGERVMDEQFNVTVSAKSDISRSITVTSQKYKSVPNPEAMFQVYFTAKNESTTRTLVTDDTFELGKPNIVFKVPGTVEFKRETEAVVKCKNTLPIPLTKCRFHIESTGALNEVIQSRAKVGVGEEWSVSVLLKPYKATKETSMLVATFHSEEIIGIMGYSDDFEIIKRPLLRDEGDPSNQ